MTHWKPKSKAIHQEFCRRAQAKNKLMDEAEIVNFLALALCGEAGELANLIKKMWRGDSISPEKIRHEIADIRIYLDHLADHLGVNIDDACEEKLAIVQERLDAEAA